MPRADLLDEAYIRADADLGAVIAAFEPDNVMLISDHGSSRLKGDFLLNVWLRDRGYCIYRENSPLQQQAALDWILVHWFHEHVGWFGRPVKVLRRLIRILLPRMPAGIRTRFWRKIEETIPFAESHVRRSTTPDFERSAVFPGSLYSGVLYFNVSGREPGGVLPAAERRALASKLKEELSAIQDPDTGKPLFTGVYRADELYHGAAADHAPDLVVDAYGSPWNIRTRQPAPLEGKSHGRYFITFDQKRDFGWHGPDGIFVFSGQDFPSGPANGTGQLMDVPATLLHVYDVPVPADWDGRVMNETLSAELSRRPVREQPGDTDADEMPGSSISSDDAKSLLDHLQALGYL
jgi:predicted AlkP superfamily phosphohydrolase/phosphomutase